MCHRDGLVKHLVTTVVRLAWWGVLSRGKMRCSDIMGNREWEIQSCNHHVIVKWLSAPRRKITVTSHPKCGLGLPIFPIRPHQTIRFWFRYTGSSASQIPPKSKLYATHLSNFWIFFSASVFYSGCNMYDQHFATRLHCFFLPYVTLRIQVVPMKPMMVAAQQPSLNIIDFYYFFLLLLGCSYIKHL